MTRATITTEFRDENQQNLFSPQRNNTSVILLWLTPDNFTRQMEGFRRERVDAIN